jgi:cobalamin-dependent methionine synthase I
MLDAIASEATELAADGLEQRILDERIRLGAVAPSTSLVRYSPGYCGWHLSGQRALFAALKPEAIGLTLRDSCLMEPLKSISGVMVLGHPDIHEFSPTYSCCSECRTATCLPRMRRVPQPHTRVTPWRS